MSTSVNFVKSEFGFQSTFGTAVTPNFILPFRGSYQNARTIHEGTYDAGIFFQGKNRVKVNDYATFTIEGDAFFELLPLFLNAGYDWTAATTGAAGPPQLYTYDDAISLTAEGSPRPITFRHGGGENLGGTGPAIQIADAYCESLTLSGNLNTGIVQLRSSWFGKSIDTNSHAGYAFAATAPPPNRKAIRAAGNAFELQDATTTGGDFATMTATSCKMLDWELTYNFGARPKWGADAAAITYCGVRFENATIEFRPTFRTDSQTYSLIYEKFDDITYQELRFSLNGEDGRQMINQLTGLWVEVPTAHGRTDGEVTMSPVWMTEPYIDQTTTPHLASWQLDTAADITT